MRLAGVICEYNPFHTGHAYQLADLRDRTGADAVVCLMSGEFTQRGEAAITDKRTRARLALEHGADLVVELPFLFAVQSAQRFADGAVRMLSALGCRYIGFGAETAEPDLLNRTARILANEPLSFQAAVKTRMANGDSYPRAIRMALQQADPVAGRVLACPNNLLAVQYISSIFRHNLHLTPVITRRSGAGHDSGQTPADSQFPSSKSIRALLNRAETDLPALLRRFELPENMSIVRGDTVLFNLISASFRLNTPREYDDILDIEDGLAFRIARAARSEGSLEALLSACTSRRFTESRLRRVLLYCLFGVTRRRFHASFTGALPGARVLGIRADRTDVLSWVSRYANTNVSPSPRKLPRNDSAVLDEMASDLYGLLMDPIQPAGADLRARLLVV